jgi:cobalt transport protein
MKRLTMTITLGLLFAALAFVSSAAVSGLSGSDDRAKDVVSDLTGDTYHPWIESPFRTDSTTEHLLFSFQAGIGGLLFGYFLSSRKYRTIN